MSSTGLMGAPAPDELHVGSPLNFDDLTNYGMRPDPLLELIMRNEK